MTIVGIIVGILVLVCCVLGAFMVYKGVEDIRYGVGSRTWPLIAANLEKCVLNVRVASGKGTLYNVSVSYTYVLAGKCYKGNCLAIGYGASNSREAHELAYERVISMRQFSVRYNPSRPEMSVIFPAENALVYGTFVFGVFWLILTTAFAFAVLAISGIGEQILGWIH